MIKRSRMLKKSLAVITSLALGLTLTDFNPLVQETKRVLAADVLIDSGNCGKTGSDNVQWKLYDTDGDSKGDKLIFSGTGNMRDYKPDDDSYTYPSWYSYKNGIKTIIVGEDVISIGSGAFNFFGNLTSVSLPSGLTSIGRNAFEECTNLALTELPSGITSIGKEAFEKCANITLTELPSGLTSIEDGTFRDCENLALTSLPSGITSIGEHAFEECTNLALTSLPSGITTIGDCAFMYCSNLALTELPSELITIEGGSWFGGAFYGCENITLTELPSKLTSIGDFAFYECTNIALTELPSGLTSIGNYAFYKCDKLTLAELPSGITSIGYSAFFNCKDITLTELPSGITSIGSCTFYGCENIALTSLPSGITSIGHAAFYSCYKLALTELPPGLNIIYNNTFYNCNNIALTELPSGITSIGDYAFYQCTKLALTELPSGLTSIGNSAFDYCYKLTLTELPSGITSIGEKAFRGCDNLTLTSLPSGITTIENETFDGCDNLALTSLPSGITSIGVDAFRRCYNLALTELPSGLTSIGNGAFYECKNITLTSLPSGLTSIEGFTFQFCNKLALTSLPSGITSIGYQAFYGSGNVALTSLPSSLTTIGDYAFDGCANMTITELPSGLTSIGKAAFEGCSNIALTSLPSGLTSIGDRNFSGCTNLALTELPSGITSIGNSAFNGCKKITLTELPSGITSIGDSAFSGCVSLASISLPSGLTSISSYAFSNCTSLALTELPPGLTSIGNSAFNGCKEITLTELPSGLTSIGDSTFSGCKNITLTELPSGINTIGDWAFSGCENITLTELPSGITSIGNYAFSDCTKLNSITLPAGLTSIGNGAFYNCANLETLTIPDSVTSIGSRAINCPTVKMKYNPSATYKEHCIYSETILLDCDDGADLTNLTTVEEYPEWYPPEFRPTVYPQTVILPSDVDPSTLTTGSNFAGFYKLDTSSTYIPEVEGPIAMHESWGIDIGHLNLKEGCHYNGDLNVQYLYKPSSGAVTVDANIHSQPNGEFILRDDITFNGDIEVDSDSILSFVGDNITVNGTIDNSAVVTFFSNANNVNINTLNNNSSGHVLMCEEAKDSVNINTLNKNGGSYLSLPGKVKDSKAYTTGSAVTLENGNLNLTTPWRDFEALGETFKYDPSKWNITYRNNTSEYTGDLRDYDNAPRVEFSLNNTRLNFGENFNIYNIEFSDTQERDPSLLKSPATCTEDAVYYYRCTTPGQESYFSDAHTWVDTGSALGHDFTSKVEDDEHKRDENSWWYNCSRCDETSDTYYWYKHTGPMIDSTLTITPSTSISDDVVIVLRDEETGDETLHEDASDIPHQIPDDGNAHSFLITILTANGEAEYNYEIREQVKLTVQNNDYITKSAITPLTKTLIEETVFGIADVQERAEEDWEFPSILIPTPTPTPNPRPSSGSGGSSSSGGGSSAPAPVPTQTPKPKTDFYVDGKATPTDTYKTLGDIPIPQMPGKVFDGWVDEQGKPLTSDTPVKAGMKISATWKDKPTTPITNTTSYSGSVIAVDFSLVPDADRYQLVDKDGNIKIQNINFNTLTTGLGRVYLNPKEYDEVRIQAMYKNQVLCDSSLIKISGVPMLSSNVKTLFIGEGGTVNPMAYMTPSSATGSVMSIKSTNPKVVKVTKTSMLKGVKAGKAKVTVKASDGSTVTFNIKVIGTYKPKKTTLQVGDRINLKKYVKGHTILRAESANPKVVKVSKSFKSLTAKKKGNTTVIITVENYGTKTVEVKVKDKTIS